VFSRRGSLLASIAAGATLTNRNALATASQPSTPVNFGVPAGATDCHVVPLAKALIADHLGQ
jgi:hypothetical protein